MKETRQGAAVVLPMIPTSAIR